MSVLTQKQAVYDLIDLIKVIDPNKQVMLTHMETEWIVKNLVIQFNKGMISNKPDVDDLSEYCGRLLGNYLKKDSRLNGGSTFYAGLFKETVDPTCPSMNTPICECGAKHTAFPDHHSSYCPLNKGK